MEAQPVNGKWYCKRGGFCTWAHVGNSHVQLCTTGGEVRIPAAPVHTPARLDAETERLYVLEKAGVL